MRMSMLAATAALLLAIPARAQAPADAPPPAVAETAAVLQPAAGAVAPPDPASSGLPARAAAPRTLRAHWHVFVAFALTWALLFGYVLSLGRRFGQLERDVQRLGRAE